MSIRDVATALFSMVITVILCFWAAGTAIGFPWHTEQEEYWNLAWTVIAIAGASSFIGTYLSIAILNCLRRMMRGTRSSLL